MVFMVDGPWVELHRRPPVARRDFTVGAAGIAPIARIACFVVAMYPACRMVRVSQPLAARRIDGVSPS
jgi:hypothetical protein